MIEKEDTAAGFLSDPHFREWVLLPNAKNSLYWETFQAAHPGEQEALEWAREVLTGLQVPRHALAEEKADKLWAAIEAGMDAPPCESSGAGSWFKWSAWMLGLLGLAWLLMAKGRRIRAQRPSRV